MHNYRPRITFDGWRELLHFSKWLLLGNLCGFIYGRSSTLIVGKISGEHAFGVFTLSEDIAGIVTTNLLMPLRRAILPDMPSSQTTSRRLHDIFVDIFAVVFLVSAPLTLGIAVVADPLVRITLGPQWLGAIPLIQILCVGEFLQARNRCRRPDLYCDGTSTLHDGAIRRQRDRHGAVADRRRRAGRRFGGSLRDAGVSPFCSAALDFVLVNRLLHLSLAKLLAGCWRSIISVVVMVAAVTELQALWPISQSFGNMMSMLAAAVAVGGVVYSVCGFTLWFLAGRPRGAERHLFEAVKMALGGISRTLYRSRAAEG